MRKGKDKVLLVQFLLEVFVHFNNDQILSSNEEANVGLMVPTHGIHWRFVIRRRTQFPFVWAYDSVQYLDIWGSISLWLVKARSSRQ